VLCERSVAGRGRRSSAVLLDGQHENTPYLQIQYNSRLARPPDPSPSLPATTPLSPLPDDSHCQVRQSPFDERKMLLCDICNAEWHTNYLLPPLTTIPIRTWQCPLCTLRHPLPQTATRHLLLPSPILDPNSEQTPQKKKGKKEKKQK